MKEGFPPISLGKAMGTFFLRISRTADLLKVSCWPYSSYRMAMSKVSSESPAPNPVSDHSYFAKLPSDLKK